MFKGRTEFHARSRTYLRVAFIIVLIIVNAYNASDGFFFGMKQSSRRTLGAFTTT